MKRTIAMLLAAVLLGASLTGCSETTDSEKTPASEGENPAAPAAEEVNPEPETEAFSDGLEDRDFGGRIYTVLYRDEAEHLREITAEELTGDVINDAIYNRTADIQQRFNVTLGLLPVSEGNLNSRQRGGSLLRRWVPAHDPDGVSGGSP